MKIQTDGCMRHELKFLLPRTCMDGLRQEVRRHAELDRFCSRIPDSRYIVRSIYLDTVDFEFYFEKIDGLKVRKKLRIRTYNSPEAQGPAFIEIKRKVGRCGLKERVQLPLARVDHALNGKDPDRVLPEPTFRNRKVLGKIRYLIHVKDLRPVVLVTYEREAYVGNDNARQRVTFDSNIRSLVNPSLAQIGEERGLKQFEDTYFVLELKYDGSMPGWMTRLIRDFDLERGPYSKYCNGLDVWRAVAVG